MWVRGRLSHRASRRQAWLTEAGPGPLMEAPEAAASCRQPAEAWPLCSVVGIPQATQHPLSLTPYSTRSPMETSGKETDCALLIPMG